MTTPVKTEDRFRLGLGFVVLVGFSLVNFFILLYAVPKFGEIYADALPGKPLPLVTEIILGGRLAIILFNAAWLAICGYLLRRRNRHSILLINLASICNFFEIGVTIVALMMPMVGTITGMSPQVACS